MTFEEYATKFLTDNGMCETDAKAILDEVKKSPANEAMQNRWQDKIEDYPAQMKVVVLVSTKELARDWIADHVPKHWARPMFD